MAAPGLSCGTWDLCCSMWNLLLAACGLLSCGMRTLSCGLHAGSSSPTRDQTQAPCIGRVESYPLDHQGNPNHHNFRTFFLPQKVTLGTSLVVQWLRLCSPNVGGTGSIPDQGTEILYVHGVTKKKKKKNVTLYSLVITRQSSQL